MNPSRDGGRRPPRVGGVLDADLPAVRPAAAAWLARGFRPLEALFNRVYGSRWNPLYKSGPLAILFLLVTLVTGVYLFIFYKVADPYGSVARLDATWLGSLVRSLHRYAADLAVVAIAIHALKMLLAGRTWGPRSLAWRSGLVLLGGVLFCGWTGLVMAWDVQGQWIAWEGARLLDLLPVLSEPISRSFVRPGSVDRPFFFTNLFLHVALPLGVAGLLWVHASRVARPEMLPPRKMMVWTLVLLGALSILVPVPLPPEADLLARPVDVPLDVFYAFWLPVARALPAWGHLALWVAVALVLFSLPAWWRPRRAVLPASSVDESRCTGCSTCYEDCPFDAIAMVERAEPSSLSLTVARVDPELCVSCGICSGSCAPMGVGPPNRTGREQLGRVRDFVAAHDDLAGRVAVVSCRHAFDGVTDGALDRALRGDDGSFVLTSGCPGSVHTSSLEALLSHGAAGVFVLTCPPRDCLYREGPKWLEQRIYFEREAELQSRVDRRRVRIAAFGPGEAARAADAIEAFERDLAATKLEDGALDAGAQECDVRDAYVEEVV
ncbi:MAG: hydrogenase iron-sulfur subunit [Thermoanaerobaculia bacterium]|nr:hydrogenase iron-sulfur subunit [Thermoanaerobaculia bacterium]